MPDITVTIQGLDSTLDRLQLAPLLAQPLRNGFEAVGYLLTSEAKRRAPVDRGLLRASIAHKVDQSSVPMGVEIGAKPFYAPYMEFGTGLVHDHPSWPRKRHMVPAGALDGWAKRKGLDGGAVARSINKRGGLKPRRFLRGALEGNEARVVSIVTKALKSVAL
jgi:HK97 gp10 family phage protein